MLLGAILAGGEARRFGADKAMALLAGRPLIDHVRAALAPHCAQIVLCGREGEGAIPDRPAPGLGPLGGLNAALHCAREQGFAAVLSAPCDTPVLPAALMTRLAEHSHGAMVAELPVLGIWPVALAPLLDRHLADTADRSMRGWARVAGVECIAAGQNLTNVNFPDDLRRLSGFFP